MKEEKGEWGWAEHVEYVADATHLTATEVTQGMAEIGRDDPVSGAAHILAEKVIAQIQRHHPGWYAKYEEEILHGFVHYTVEEVVRNFIRSYTVNRRSGI